MSLQEKTLAELAQGENGFATLRVADKWRKGFVFTWGETFFGFIIPKNETEIGAMFSICRFRILNNGVKVGSEVLAIPAAELKALLSEAENG